MKAKKLFVYTCTIVIGITISKNMLAQQAPKSKLTAIENVSSKKFTNYSTRIFKAPNNTYGYDIIADGMLIYHQPAFSRVPTSRDAVMTKEEHANSAASITIEKLKQGKNPQLSNDELQKIINHQK